MANLKADLANEINRKLRFSQIELSRLAQSGDMVYSDKLDLMEQELEKIAILEGELNLVQRFFPEPQQTAPAPETQQSEDAQNIVASQEEPTAQPVAGQSHGE